MRINFLPRVFYFNFKMSKIFKKLFIHIRLNFRPIYSISVGKQLCLKTFTSLEKKKIIKYLIKKFFIVFLVFFFFVCLKTRKLLRS